MRRKIFRPQKTANIMKARERKNYCVGVEYQCRQGKQNEFQGSPLCVSYTKILYIMYKTSFRLAIYAMTHLEPIEYCVLTRPDNRGHT